MKTSGIDVEIMIQGSLDPNWMDWFDGLAVSTTEQGYTCLRGPLPDHAALHGILERIRDLNLKIRTVQVLDGETGR
jgi:hypothetical protein